MGLPIALGGKTVSSRRIALPSPLAEDSEDGERLEPRIVPVGPLVTMSVSPDRKLSITCSITYCEMMDANELVDHAVANVRIQVSPSGEPYSSRYRDTLHRIRLPEVLQPTEPIHPASRRIQPSVMVTGDGRNMACVIPHYQDHCLQSVVVTFQLRKPRLPLSAPPRPSYLVPASSTLLVPVTTNPRVVVFANEEEDLVLMSASCICEASTHSTPYQPTVSSSSMLLIGCVNGTILAASYRPARIAGRLFQARDSGGLSSNDAIASMKHHTISWTDMDGARGRLVVLMEPSGMAVLFQSHLLLQAVGGTGSSGRNEASRAQATTEDTQSHLMVNIEPSLDLDGPFVNAEWITGSYLALLCRPDGRSAVAAEVWAIPPSSSKPAEPISTLNMTTERLDEYHHGTFRLEESDETHEDQELHSDNAEESAVHVTTSLQYDSESGCLAVSSLVLLQETSVARPFSCIWNWRTNVVGLTLAARDKVSLERHGTSLLSHMYFGKDLLGGNRLVHWIADCSKNRLKEHRVRREIYAMGILSPASAVTGREFHRLEASALMLSAKSVAFPILTKPVIGDDAEVAWIESLIPAHYTSLYGPPRIAAIGRKRGRSVAVAASRGLCVLDYHRTAPSQQKCGYTQLAGNRVRGGESSGGRGVPKWRMFGSETEERTFEVLAMAWWESGDTSRRVGDVMADDLLVAIIREKTKDVDGRAYLSCWSRRKLDLQNQLLRPRHTMRGSNSSLEIGMALPNIPYCGSSLSLLSEPTAPVNCDGERKAIVLLSFSDGRGDSNENLSYFLYHLSTDPGDQFSVVRADLCSHGALSAPDGDCVTEVFLAGCSFQFCLTKPKPTQIHQRSFLATLGIVYGGGKGVDAIAVTPSGLSAPFHVIESSDLGQDTMLKSCEVSALWQSNSVASQDLHARAVVTSSFSWTFSLRDGRLFCWTIPYIDRRNDEMVIIEDQIDRPVHVVSELFPPVFLCTSKDEESALPLLLGTVTRIGDSSTWLQEASNANRVQFSLGCLPGSEFGCILRSAQGSRELHRIVPSWNEGDMCDPELLDHEIFYLGDTTMAPPAFINALYATLLGSANEHALRIREGDSIPSAWDFKAMRQMAILSIKKRATEDTITTALRVLILRVVEVVALESEKPRGDSVMLATSLFAELVDAARYLVTPMHFISLLLGIARQIEPSCIPHLFPLPMSTAAFRSDADPIEGWRTVNDLFLASLYHGSLSSPSAALPLFASKRTTLYKSIDLLKRCLRAFEENSMTKGAIIEDCCREERLAIHDLFLFGSKLENAGLVEEGLARRLADSAIENGTGRDENSVSTVASSFVNVKAPHSAGTSRRKTSICSLLLPSILTGKYRRAKEEDAIHEAASSFISSGFEESDFEFIPLAQTSVPLEISYEDVCDVSVTGTIVDFLLSLCLDHKPVKPYYRWKKSHALAQILLGDSESSKRLDGTSCLVIGFKNLAALIPLSAFSVLAKATGRKHDELIESKQLVAELLASKIIECDGELSSNDALLVLRLVCTLLARHEKSKDVESCISGIVFLGLVAGHVAGVSKDLLGQTFELSAIGSSYAVAIRDLKLREANR